MLVDEPRPRSLPLAVYYCQMDHHGNVTIITQEKEHPPRAEWVRQKTGSDAVCTAFYWIDCMGMRNPLLCKLLLWCGRVPTIKTDILGDDPVHQ